MLRYLTTKQAAEATGLSKEFFEKDRVTGLHRVPYLKVGRKVLYDAEALQKWMAAHAVNADEAADGEASA